MIFTDFISLLGDFCLYTATLGFIVSSFTKSFAVLVPACAYLVAIILFMLMRNVKSVWRFAPILVFVPVFILAKGVVGYIWPVPLVILLLMRAATGSWSAEHNRTQLLFKIMPFVYAVITLLSKASALYCRYSLPYFLAWLLISVVVMRMLRAPGLDALGTRFKILNVLLVVVIAGLVFLLSSDVCLNAIKVAFVFCYNKLIMPIFLVVVYACIALPGVIYYIIKLICALFGGGELPSAEAVIGEAINEEYRDTFEFKEAPEWIGKAAAAAGIIILLVICILIFRKLLAKKSDDQEDLTEFHRESVDVPQPLRSKRRFSFSNSPEDVVRSSYRHYLELCEKNDVTVDGSNASDIISRESVPFAGKESPEKLRDLWLPARYSELAISPEDAKESKELLKDMRAHANKKKD